MTAIGPDDKGRLIGRPMLVPAVGAGLAALTSPRGKRTGADEELDWIEDDDGELIPGFTAVKRKRMGMFTPVAPIPTEASADEEIARERET